MTEATMTPAERDEILDALIANDQARELGEAVEPLRGRDDNEFGAKSLVSYADHFDTEVSQRVRDLIRRNPQRHGAVLSALRIGLELVEAERTELKSSDDLEAARKLKDVDHFERYVREIGRDILRQNEAR